MKRQTVNTKALSLDKKIYDKAQATLDTYRTGSLGGVNMKMHPMEWNMAVGLNTLYRSSGSNGGAR